MELQQTKVKHFLKLGFPISDIQRVLQSLQQDAQTNDILEELIKTCRTHDHTVTNNHNVTHNHTRPGAERVTHSQSNSPKLIPRGCSPHTPSQMDTHSQRHTHNDTQTSSPFRPVVIDGSNVAISHGNKQVFSCRGIQLAVQWFWDRGIRDITVFVPLWRKEQSRPEAPITDQHILSELERRSILVYTPSRCVNGRRVVCYDDRYIIKLAYDSDGLIVSNDNYRDLQQERPEWRSFIQERLLMYTFANDMFMPPDDPLGRNGPTIENFLRKKPTVPENKQQHCPYGKKCTYGIKCKFYHPERSNLPQLSVAEELRARIHPGFETEELSHCAHPTHQLYQQTSSSYSNNTQQRPSRPSEHQAELTRAFSGLDLYSDPAESLGSLANLGYLQRSLPALCRSPKSDRAYGSMDSSMCHHYHSDSALPTSLAYSSNAFTGSDSDYYPSSGSTRAHSPEVFSRAFSRRPTLSSCQHAHSDLGLNYAHSHRYSSHSSYNHPASAYPQQASHPRIAELGWAQRQAQLGEAGAFSHVPDRRKDVRSQLSTIFPQSTVDQVMSLYPHTLDTTELVTLIKKYRNTHLL